MAARTPKIPKTTPAELRERIAYDPLTGSMLWRERAVPALRPGFIRWWNNRYAGTPALQYEDSLGYRRGSLSGDMILAHRAAWALYYGEWPISLIDHIDGNPRNNAISNLRSVNAAGNARNTRRRRENTTGVTGVSRCRDGKYWAQIGVAGEVIYLGTFAAIAEAAAARKAAERKYGFHPNHGRTA